MTNDRSPLARMTPPAAARERASSSVIRHSSCEPQASGHPSSVVCLLIEDNHAEARLVREHLAERFGDELALHAQPTLTGGLEWLDTQSADVILLDLTLPDSAGLDTYHRVHRHAPRTPVVILSGRDDDALALDAVRAGAADYLAKQHADGVALARTMRHAVERQRAERALRDSEARFRAIVETAEEGIVQLDAHGRIVFANARLARLLGSSSGELQGRRFVELVDAPYVPLAEHLLRAGAPRRTGELRLQRAGGEPLWMLAAAGANADGAHAEVVMLTDIGARVSGEAELVRIARALERRVGERGVQLAALQVELDALHRVLAHELRAGLRSIAALAEGGDSAALPQIAHAAQAAAARVEELLKGNDE